VGGRDVAEKTDAFDSIEQGVFKALENQKRRDILRLIGEKKGISFTEVLNAIKIQDSPSLAYHMKELAPFIQQKSGKYQLTPMGRDAYSLLSKATAYGKVTLFQKQRYEVTFGNLLLWTAGIAAAAYLEVDTMLTTIIMPMLAFVATMITYQLFEDVK
jgi:DNA-binding transcriptional ArsR family regulator